MMPTFPRSPLKFRTVGLPSVRLQGRNIRRGLPVDYVLLVSHGLPPSLVPPATCNVDPRSMPRNAVR